MAEQQELFLRAFMLEQKLDIKDRKWRLKTFKNCFIGEEAIKEIINLKFATSIQEAIVFGNKLIQNDIIKHVTRKHEFKNETLFYKFTKTYKAKHPIQESKEMDDISFHTKLANDISNELDKEFDAALAELSTTINETNKGQIMTGSVKSKVFCNFHLAF